MQSLQQQKETMVYVAIQELNPAVYNPRKWSKKATDDLTASIKRFGLIDPIIVNKARGNTVVGGHFRLHVAKKLGYTEVPCVFVSIEDERQEKELNLRLNKNSGDWDWSLLKDWETSLLKEAGFDDSELKEMMDQVLEPVKEDDFDPTATLEAKETKVKLGDVWQLGKHRLMCGSSAEKESVIRLMDGKQADMVFTDPPYGVSYVGKTKDALTIENDAMDEEGTAELWAAAYAELRNILRDGGIVYATVPAGPLHLMFAQAMKDYGDLRQIMVWVKDRFVLGRSDYHYRHEPILYGWKNTGAHSFLGGRDKDTVWEIDRPSANREHPTMKPIALIEKAILEASLVGCLVYDCFAGSGSTLIACEQTKRICYTMELDPKYCDVVIARWEKLTGQTAIKL